MTIIDVVNTLPAHKQERYKTRPLSAITYIVVHHSATTSGTPSAFARYHVDIHGWPGIAYHYVLAKDGTIYKTQNSATVSYHAGNANAYSVGICLVGDYDKVQPPMEQMHALIKLINELREALHIPIKHIIGHREVPASKSCPGKAFDMDELRARLGDGA